MKSCQKRRTPGFRSLERRTQTFKSIQKSSKSTGIELPGCDDRRNVRAIMKRSSEKGGKELE